MEGKKNFLGEIYRNSLKKLSSKFEKKKKKKSLSPSQ